MNKLFQTSVSPSGELACILDGDKNSVWMYLKDLVEDEIIGDVSVCSRKNLISLAEFKSVYKGEGVPPFVISFSSSDAVMRKIKKDSFTIIWADDETYVDVEVVGKTVSRIEKGREKGLSIFALKEGPWGDPWAVK